jgi:hypothetical protein
MATKKQLILWISQACQQLTEPELLKVLDAVASHPSQSGFRPAVRETNALVDEALRKADEARKAAAHAEAAAKEAEEYARRLSTRSTAKTG